jgi:hypothetical protein
MKLALSPLQRLQLQFKPNFESHSKHFLCATRASADTPERASAQHCERCDYRGGRRVRLAWSFSFPTHSSGSCFPINFPRVRPELINGGIGLERHARVRGARPWQRRALACPVCGDSVGRTLALCRAQEHLQGLRGRQHLPA